MTDLDQDLVPAVLELITDFGKSMSFEVYSSQSYSEIASTVTRSTSTYVTLGLPPEKYDISYVDGDVVRFSDLKTMVAASGLQFTPTPGMKVTFDSKSFTAVGVSPIYSGELVAAWEIQLRA